MIQEGILWGILGILAWQDFRSQKLPMKGLIAALAAGIGSCLWESGGNPLPLLSGLLPGLGILFLSRATGGAIGAGDGWVLLAAGCFLGGWQAIRLFWGGLLLAFVYAGALFLWKKERKKTFPFLPFLWLAHSLDILGRLAGW